MFFSRLYVFVSLGYDFGNLFSPMFRESFARFVHIPIRLSANVSSFSHRKEHGIGSALEFGQILSS